MTYILHPLEQLDDAYCSRYDNEDDATREATRLCEQYGVDIIVATVLCTMTKKVVREDA